MENLTVSHEPKLLYTLKPVLINSGMTEWGSNSQMPILYIILLLILKEK